MAARMGERNNRSTCSDAEVALAVELALVHRLPTDEVAAKFEVNVTTVRRWIRGATRVLRRAH